MDLKRAVENVCFDLSQDDLLRKCIAKTKYYVEAQPFPLWEKYSLESDFKSKTWNIPKLNWKSVNVSIFKKIGEFGGYPVCFNLQWYTIEGVYVAFWEATSQAVFYPMIEDYLREMFPNAEKILGASNFGGAIIKIKKDQFKV